MKSVIIFGAEISGLSAAHELSRLGYKIAVYEAMDQPGGFFRSPRHSNSNGRSLKDFPIIRIEVWHEWEFSSEGINHIQPKWVTTSNTHDFMPSQTTPLDNLFLAGSHTATQAHVRSIEGAVESGRRAAKAIDPRVTVIDQYVPQWLRIVNKIDDLLFAVKGPHVMDLTFAVLLFSVLWFLV